MNVPATNAPTIVEGLYSFQLGGSEKLGALLARQLAARGYRTLVLSFFDTDGPIRAELEGAGIACAGLDVARRSRWQRITLARELQDWLESHRPDVLHLHHGVTAIRGVLPARRAGVRRIVMTEHADLQLRTERRYRAALARALPEVDVTTVVNDELVAYFEETFEYCGRDTVAPLRRIRNAVDPAYTTLVRDDAARRDLGIADEFVFVYVGRLVGEKSLDTMLEAFRRVVVESPTAVRLVLAGDGPERASLEAQAERLGIEGRLLWLGAQVDARLALSLADAFVMSSRSEGLPMALLEAMSATLPCVATDVGGIAALLGVDRGWVVPSLQPAALANAMGHVLRDPVARVARALAGRDAVLRDHSIDAVVDAYLDAFALPRRWIDRAA